MPGTGAMDVVALAKVSTVAGGPTHMQQQLASLPDEPSVEPYVTSGLWTRLEQITRKRIRLAEQRIEVSLSIDGTMQLITTRVNRRPRKQMTKLVVPPCVVPHWCNYFA